MSAWGVPEGYDGYGGGEQHMQPDMQPEPPRISSRTPDAHFWLTALEARLSKQPSSSGEETLLHHAIFDAYTECCAAGAGEQARQLLRHYAANERLIEGA